MQNLVLTHSTWRHLLQALRAHHSFKRLAHFPNELLSTVLLAPVTVARWLSIQHPELLAKDSLHLVIAGAAPGPDSLDQGRWYQTIPLLVGKPEMALSISLVSPSSSTLAEFKQYRMNPSESVRSLESVAASSIIDLIPAMKEAKPIGVWANESEYAGTVDACFIFNPAMEAFSSSWFNESQGLPSLLAQNVPIGCSSSCIEAFWHDSWLCGLYGHEAVLVCGDNPFKLLLGSEKKAGHWGALSWSIQAAPLKEASLKNQKAQLIRFYLALEQARPGFTFAGNAIFGLIGGEFTASNAKTAATMTLVGLPPGIFISLHDGRTYGLSLEGELEPLPLIPPIPVSELETFPDSLAHPVERYIWACELFRAEIEPYLYLEQSTHSLNTYYDLFNAPAPSMPPGIPRSPSKWGVV